MRNKLTSSLSALTPVRVWDMETGEEVSNWNETVHSLLSFIHSKVIESYSLERSEVERVCALERSCKPAEHARQHGLKLTTKPPYGVKAVSRIEKLYQEKLVSEVTAYLANPNPKKQPPSFYPKINLGAVDRQMASLSIENTRLSLQWKVWDREFLFEFEVPVYVLSRDIVKWSLPVVQASRKTGEPVFLFSFQEAPKARVKYKNPQTAGVDLGRVIPFTAAVLNEEGARVAHYTSSGRLNQSSAKRSRLLDERAQTITKLKHYQTLNYNPLKQEVLQYRADLLKSKIRRLGHHIAWLTASELAVKLEKHSLNLVKLEDLSWVKGAKYGGRWNHSTTQSAITHTLTRKGINTRKINPKNTSQECHKCGSKITHNTKNRTIHCTPCKQTFDRDYNAAMNIANKPLHHPLAKRTSRDNCSTGDPVQVIGANPTIDSMAVTSRKTT